MIVPYSERYVVVMGVEGRGGGGGGGLEKNTNWDTLQTSNQIKSNQLR